MMDKSETLFSFFYPLFTPFLLMKTDVYAFGHMFIILDD